jgi:hypothetical protein
MKRILFAFALALSFAPAAFANHPDKYEQRASAAPESQASEFAVGLDPGMNVRDSSTGKLFALDLNPHINVSESTAPLFAADLSPAINLSSRTQGLFDINPHINVR